MISYNIDKYRKAKKMHFDTSVDKSICCWVFFLGFFDIDGAEEETRISNLPLI